MSARIVSLQDEYRRLETERSEAIESRQALGAQEAENKTVKAVRLPLLSCLTRQEFAKLTPNNNVYKQMGPVLVKQDQVEAKANVDKRLEFIAGEMCVTALIDQLTRQQTRRGQAEGPHGATGRHAHGARQAFDRGAGESASAGRVTGRDECTL